jgi:excisionase family DNA binding protein
MTDTSLALLPVEEAARRLSIARTKAYELIRAGDLQSVKVGRVRRVPATAIDDYVRRLTAPAVA